MAAPATMPTSSERASGVVDQAAGRAGSEHVQLASRGSPRRSGQRPRRAGVAKRSQREPSRSQATTRAPAAASRAASAPPTLPSPITPTRRPSSVVRAGLGRQGAAHRREHGLRGHGGGVAAAALRDRAPGAEAREAGHVVHVRRGGADVLGRDVGAAEALDHPGRRLEPLAARCGRRRRRSSPPCRRPGRARRPTPSASSCGPGPSRPPAPPAGRPDSASAAGRRGRDRGPSSARRRSGADPSAGPGGSRSARGRRRRLRSSQDGLPKWSYPLTLYPVAADDNSDWMLASGYHQW